VLRNFSLEQTSLSPRVVSAQEERDGGSFKSQLNFHADGASSLRVSLATGDATLNLNLGDIACIK